MIQGLGEGVAACIGEFPDVTFSTQPDGAGGLTTKFRPQRVFGGTDAVAKFGGWDSTIGDFGISGGNGYVDALKSKQFSALVLVAVNIASAKAARVVRSLPTNVSPTNPSPVVGMQATAVPASYEFKTNAGNRVRCAGAQKFTDTAAYASGADGSLAAAGPLGSVPFTSAGIATAIAAGLVRVGDILVIGVIGHATYGVAGIMGPYHGTYRVLTCPAGGPITIEALDGSNLTVPTQATIPWRLHAAATADSAAQGQPGNAGAAYATQAAFRMPARPLDATIVASSIVPPSLPDPAPTATAWTPLADVTFLAGTADIVYTAAVQAPNAASSGSTDGLYTPAFDALLFDAVPAKTVNIVWASRTSAAIRAYGKTHAGLASQRGVGRMFVSAPGLDTQTLAAAGGAASPGVGANRDERTIYTWPGTQVYVSEAVNTQVATAIVGAPTADGNLDVRMDGFIASILSVLAPERNPGQTAPPVGGSGGVLSPLLGLQRGAPDLTIDSYVYLRSQGIAALHFDDNNQPEIVSGVTSSLTSGQTNINRRRFADFIEDSLSSGLMPFAKLPVTDVLADTALGEVDNFLADLKATGNPTAQRIADYACAITSSPDMLANGIFQITVQVKMLPTADFIVLQASIGPTVQITLNVGGGTVTSV